MSNKLTFYFTLSKKLIKNINKNVAGLIMLNLVTAVSQFIVYTVINRSLGAELLGVWSLVSAALSIGQISNFGFSNSLIRHLPEMLSEKNVKAITRIIGTVNFLNFTITLPLLCLLYFPALTYASNLLTKNQMHIFSNIIPISLAGLFTNSLFLVYSYLFDAMQKHYVRSTIQVIGWVIFLLVSMILIPQYGLIGVSIAFLVQNLFQFVLIVSIVNYNQLLGTKYPLSLDKSFFDRIFSFGVKSQYINLLTLFFDPLIKFFITKNLGISFTGAYEIANKIVSQIRNFLVGANVVIIPKIILHKRKEDINEYYNEISKRNMLFSITLGMLILLGSPAISYFFSGYLNESLIQNIALINLGWVCNMITSIHYYSCIGLDKMNKLVVYHVVLVSTVFGLYYFLPTTISSPMYFSIPSFALFVGSFYNSYILRQEITNATQWLKSKIFIYFIFVSILIILLYSVSANLLTHTLMPVLFLVYIIAVIPKIKLKKLIEYKM